MNDFSMNAEQLPSYVRGFNRLNFKKTNKHEQSNELNFLVDTYKYYKLTNAVLFIISIIIV